MPILISFWQRFQCKRHKNKKQYQILDCRVECKAIYVKSPGYEVQQCAQGKLTKQT